MPARAIKIALGIGTVILLPGGFALGASVLLLKKICYKPSGFKVISANATTIAFEITLKVKNPSKLQVNIEGYDFDLSINKTKVAKLLGTEEMVLKSQEVSEIKIPVSIEYKKLFNELASKELLLNFISRQLNKIFISLTGKFKGEMLKIPISKKIKIDYSVAEILEIAKQPSMPCDIK